MTGPSASGSENGTPTSSTSAPARSSAFRMSADRGRSGSPAVVYVTSPGRRSRRRLSNGAAIRLTRSSEGSPAACALRAPARHAVPTLLFELRRGRAVALRAKADEATVDRRSFQRRRLGLPCCAALRVLRKMLLHRLHVLVSASRE